MSWISDSKRKILLNLAVVIVFLVFISFFTEMYVRFFTPVGIYTSSYYDDELGLVITPGSRIIYNKLRHTVSYANEDGFLDIDHSTHNEKGKLRVAFFGDSYVEAMQVKVEQKFYRVLPDKIKNKEIEYFGFGISGQGILASYLNYKKQDRKYDLDIVIYVFVENDPGDNILIIAKNDMRPSARLIESHPGFEVERTYKKYNSFIFNTLRHIKRTSLLADLIFQRISLLKQKGIMLKPDEGDREMSTVANGKIPDQNDLPSTWPPEIREYSEKLAFNILSKWAKDVREDGKKLVVFYVPRGNDVLLQNHENSDSWKAWLSVSCSLLDIEIIDPSEMFVKLLKEGIKVYDDHWSPEGHMAVSRVIEEWLYNYL